MVLCLACVLRTLCSFAYSYAKTHIRVNISREYIINYFLAARGVRKVTTGITGLWLRSVQSDAAFWFFDVGSSYPILAYGYKGMFVHQLIQGTWAGFRPSRDRLVLSYCWSLIHIHEIISTHTYVDSHILHIRIIVAVIEDSVREEQFLHDMCLLGAVTVEITQILTRAGVSHIWRKYIWTPLKMETGLVIWWSVTHILYATTYITHTLHTRKCATLTRAYITRLSLANYYMPSRYLV